MAPVRIWLNRNYATTVHLIGQLRNNPAGVDVQIVASHPDPTSPMLTAADEVVPEPEPGPGFVEAALATCAKAGVDVFLPVAGQLAVARERVAFESAGVALICPPAAACELLGDKVATYRDVRRAWPDLVPPACAVRSLDDLDRACEALDEHWTPAHPLVVKPASGVGADGVRFLTRKGPRLAEILGPVGLWLPLADLRRALQRAQRRADPVPELLLMPYLPGPETSVDVLARSGRVVAAVPRTKVGRRRMVDGPAVLTDHAADLICRYELDGLANVQFRTWSGRPALLEINTRPAGGLYQSELAGLNLAWAAVAQALGRPVDLPLPRLGAEFVTVSTLVPLADQLVRR